MVIFLLPVKPLFYILAFALAAMRFERFGPHWKAPTWLVVALAAAARVALGLLSGFIAATVGKDSYVLFGAVIFTLGFALWLGVARLAFGRAPWSGLLVFALVSELVSGTLDVLMWHEVQSINFC